MKSLVLKPKCKNKTTTSKLSCLNKFFLRNQNVRTKLLLQSFNVWTKSYFETKTLKVLLRIIWNIASTQNETIWNQNVCKSFFETKKYEKKSCNETTTFQQKSCFEVKVAGQISYFETIMLEISLALKPNEMLNKITARIHSSKSFAELEWKIRKVCMRMRNPNVCSHTYVTNMVLEVGVTRLFFVRHFFVLFYFVEYY